LRPDVSIVIPTYNRAELLRDTLPALAEQSCDGFSLEVVFVSDGSTDGSASLIDEAARRWPGRFRLLSLPHSGSPARPRNVGIAAAAGEIVLLLDDDIVPDRDLAREHWQFHRSHPGEAAAATGHLYLAADVLRDPMSLFHSFAYSELASDRPLGFLFYWSCNFSAKTGFLREHGAFDEDPELHPVEDMEWGYRLVRAGMRLRYVPSAKGSHRHQMRPEWVERKGRRTGRAQFALTLRVPDRAVKERFGILSADLPPWLLLWRTLRRGAFRAVDNPLTLALLRAMGARRSARNLVTDAYYYLLFRRSVVAGYNRARREHAATRGRTAVEETRVEILGGEDA
jgi:glycosyltransferase involved in cell wall biosynthesis